MKYGDMTVFYHNYIVACQLAGLSRTSKGTPLNWFSMFSHALMALLFIYTVDACCVQATKPQILQTCTCNQYLECIGVQ